MSKISPPFAIHKTLIGIGGESKSVKRLRSEDLLIETMSDLQTRGVISEPDLLSTPDVEKLECFSDQGVIQIPIPPTITTTSPGNNLNTLVSPLETETRSHTTPANLNSPSTENLPESVHNESNSEHYTAAEAQQFVKQKSRNAVPTEITTDDEDMITYDVEEEEREQDPPDKFTIDEDPFILPKEYLRALTPS
ncbi:hypothetical protein TNCV_3513401 [Trichonephila clavipes]|nr:hypothetical protein TNCV_3513401 [Trichonephila clavipes]